MKVAIVTNSGKTVANHIGLAKKIAFYKLPSGELIDIAESPIAKKIKEENIQLTKENEGNRGLGVGHTIPEFLKENGVDIFVTQKFGKGVKDNLLKLGITPIIPESKNIDEIIAMLKDNMEREYK